VEAHPLHPVLTSLPAVGVGTAARILTEIVGKDFASAGHLASYAGLAPVTWRSGSSIRGHHPSRKGNKILKRALFLSAFAALKDPPSRAYYGRKRTEGKRQNQALIALAAADVTRSTPCSETSPSTNHGNPQSLDENHRGTPRPAHDDCEVHYGGHANQVTGFSLWRQACHNVAAVTVAPGAPDGLCDPNRPSQGLGSMNE
jgi:hypothetical protein